MTTIPAIFVSDYVDKSYEEVCDLLETWEGHGLSSHAVALPDVVFGKLMRFSPSLASLPVRPCPPAAEEPFIELRVLPVSTGVDALTELLLIAPDAAVASAPSSARAQHPRPLLQALVRDLDEAFSRRIPSARPG